MSASRGPVTVPAQDMYGTIRNVTAWPTGVPGLVVTQVPPVHRGACVGMWTVLHARSGKRTRFCLPDPEAALSLARALEGCTDWQQPWDAVRPAMKTDRYREAVAPYRPWGCVHSPVNARTVLDNGVIA